MFLSDLSIKRPVFATMMMVALVVLGVMSYRRLAIDEYPDITYPVIIAQTTYPGASPEVIVREVSKPIEEALNTVPGLKEVTSSSQEGVSIVRLMFHLSADVVGAQQDVQAKVSRIRRQLPPNIEDPVVIRFDPNDRPIISVAVQSSERPIREITNLADEVIATRIEAIQGVGGVNLSGGARRQIRVQLDPEAMRSYGISPAQVSAALQRENQEVPAGRIRRGATEQLVRVTGRVVDPATFANIAITVRNGVPVTIADVGTVIDGIEERRTAAELDGNSAVSLDILKISGANTVSVADSVRSVVGELERQLPPDVKLTVIRDDSRRIRESLDAVQEELMLGAVLTILIIYLFLNSWRSTVITGLTLPISIISAFFAMWMFGFTVNTMTLLALSLAIGLLIDDAIVVRENIVRHIEMGKDHHRAASEGTSEIGLAVVSTTLAIVAVFVPVAFMGGQIGKIFFQFGVTVTFAVLVSLFVSFTLDPMLSSIWRDPEVERHRARKRDRENERNLARGVPPQWQNGIAAPAEHHQTAAARIDPSHDPYRSRNPINRFATAFNDQFERIADRYPRGLAWSLRHRLLIVVGAGASIGIAFAIYPTLGFTWIPDVDGGEFNVNFRTAPGSALAYTTGKGKEIVAFLKSRPEVNFTYLSVGGGFRGTVNSGQIYVRLKPKNERDKSLADIQTELRVALRSIPGVRPSITGTPSIFGGFRQPIIVNVQGPESSRLKIAAAQVLAAMRQVPGIAEANSSEEGDIPQLDVRVDRQQAWAAGLGIASIASTLQPLFTGQRATRWEDPLGYTHDVIVVYPDSMRTSAEDVANIPVISSNVNPATGQPSIVPLSQVAEVRAGVGPQQIERRSLERQVSISAGVLPDFALGNVAAEARAAIENVGLPPGYSTAFTGDVQNLDETKGFVLEALLLAIIFIYLILASLFGSFVQPLSIMLALPLSFIGVSLALLLTKGTLNVMTMIGIIMLMGLVTKNGILLVDFTNQERERGLERTEALLGAARIRLRPIIMTTIAMIFGMLPLAMALGEGSESRAPMARAVIGGLLTSTLLTLFVVPVVYTLIDDAVAVLMRKRVRVVSAEPEPVAGD
ncbi:MAG: efflux RND transporter permease subunit [Gemmatimonadota bacterium]|nr:efflux RND transporter permease subunit [Gemmatimonadota bacterium]